MSIREKSEKTQINIKPHSYEQKNPQPDIRVKIIYERYRTGRTIILDDLRYLWLEDPEGCEKLARSIIEPKTDKGLETEPNIMVSIEYVKESSESTNEQLNHIDYVSSSDIPVDTLKNAQEIMNSIKLMMEKMSESELKDMLDNLNETLELKKLNNKMEYWDDVFAHKILTYSINLKKEIDILV